jgi:thiamine biosynthesis protein ThiS
VAVAVDGTVVARTDHDHRVVPDGADVEVLTAVQGG